MRQRRVAVTGLGLISPCGIDVEQSWAALVEGRSGVGPITLFDASGLDCRIAGEVKDFRPEDSIERREARRMDRFAQFAVVAADMALADSGLRITPDNAERVAAIIGSGSASAAPTCRSSSRGPTADRPLPPALSL